MNTLTKLRKAQEDLLQAEQNYTNAYETLNTAEKAHTEALEAFREEAVGLLGESLKTPSASSQEDRDNPLNWEVGDVVVLVSDEETWTSTAMLGGGLSFGDHLTVEEKPFVNKIDELWFNVEESLYDLHPEDFKWHSRPGKN